ncbi:MAG: hypothetical protein ACD_5C00309G0002 [uncultured bacterium]|nr:MAG: hypothetical protein ACD_5C00309G0002 [uncultured bacterium]
MNSSKEKTWKEVEKEIAPVLLDGGVGVLPTDTLYGLVGVALDENSVERIYKIRKRDLKKPMIILISSIDELKQFGILLNFEQKKVLKKIWPAKVSIVIECLDKKMNHLLRGGKSLAFRMPNDKDLLSLIKKTGPLVAPSANLAGQNPAESFGEAYKYFKDEVDFYVDNGKIKGEPSTLIQLGNDGKFKLLRQGAVKF